MYTVRPLRALPWDYSDPVAAYNLADCSVVLAYAMERGNGSYYDRYGYQGLRRLVCIDCLHLGEEIPLVLVETSRHGKFFRHPPGFAPEGQGRHGETADHVKGKHLLAQWARKQQAVEPDSVSEEYWIEGTRLRSDVRAVMTDGRGIALEVQRRALEPREWERRHGGYVGSGINDIWFWSPQVASPMHGPPGRSVVLDTQRNALGVLLSPHLQRGYVHPTLLSYPFSASYYALAPLTEWRLRNSGELGVPPTLEKYVVA